MRILSEVVRENHALLSQRAAEAVVDAALICREELGTGPVNWQAREALVEAVRQDPLLTAELFDDRPFPI